MKEIVIENLSYEHLQNICGVADENLKLIKASFKVDIALTKDGLIISGEDDECEKTGKVIFALLECENKQQYFSAREIVYLCKLAKAGSVVSISGLYDREIITSRNGKTVYPKTNNQRKLLEAMAESDIVFAIGPAGTGKTYLAVAYALSLFKKEEINKIILTRPAVEAGENLGFLPGDLKEKIDPYLRPLYDALHDILGADKVNRYLEQGIIEVAPLAFMRGRTLEKAFVILDEAQNTTTTQMKMFLTRLGFNSKMVVTGDITQIDLPKAQPSGLIHSLEILQEIPEIKVVRLTSIDVIRSPLVQKIIDAYEKSEEKKTLPNAKYR